MRLIVSLPLLALTACFSDPADREPANQTSAPPPPHLCEEVRKVLDGLSESAALIYADDGSAVVEERIWARTGGTGRDQIARALAFHAACTSGESSSSQRVIVRNEAGVIVSQRMVDSRVNTGSLFTN